MNFSGGESSVDNTHKFFSRRDTGKIRGLRSAIDAHREDNVFRVIDWVGIIKK